VAHQHRHILGADSEVFKHGLNIGIPLYFEIGVWLAVASQELLQTKRIRGEPGANQHETSKRLGDKHRSTAHEGPQKDFAELRVRLHDAPQSRHIDFEQFAPG
jgi:hypothetical protein